MSIDQSSPPSGLVQRVQGILLRPKVEWQLIDNEPGSVQGLYTSYVGPLAAIPAIAGAIGMSLIGVGAFGFSYKAPLAHSLSQAVVQWVLTLVGVFVLALVIENLAPTFGGTRDRLKAFKVAAYSYTPAWVAGILLLLPALSPIAALIGLYGLYLLYLGLPILMKAPADKALPYTAVTIIIAIVLWIVIGVVAAAVTAALPFGSPMAHNTPAGGTVQVGDTKVDLGKLDAAAKQAEAAAKQLQAQAEGQTGSGAVQAVAPDVLKAMLPGAVAGLARTEISSNSGGVGGVQASNAEGVYQAGDGRITLSVSDTAAMGALAGVVSSININSSSETATGYEKVGNVGGRMTTERYDRQDQSGEYGVLVANRFMVQATGSKVSMDQLKAAVRAVNIGQLERMAKG
jgi:hypothetical protein